MTEDRFLASSSPCARSRVLQRRLVFLASVVLAVLLLGTRNVDATSVPSLGSTRLYVTQNPPSSTGAMLVLNATLLARYGATIADATDTYAVVTVPTPSAAALASDLSASGFLAEVRDDYNMLSFTSMPIDVRAGEPAYPLQWTRNMPLPAPARDNFVLQFISIPRPQWLAALRAAGIQIIDYVPANAYTILGDTSTLAQVAQQPFVQYVALQQPIHKISVWARQSATPFTDIDISILNVPEAADALAYLASVSLPAGRAADPVGDRTIYHATITTSALVELANLPAVVWIEPLARLVPSGEREAHLVAGDTMVTTAGGVLKPLAGDYRSWLSAKGVSNYATTLKMATLDTGFDAATPPSAFKDFLDSTNVPFVTPMNEMTVAGNTGDCYGHGTMVAGVLAGNAGAAFSTQTKDIGSQFGDANYFMGEGIVPHMPLVVAKIIDYTSGTNCPGNYCPKPWATIFTDLVNAGVKITSASINLYPNTGYTIDSQTFDRLVRHATGVDNETPTKPMAIYISAGNQLSYQGDTAVNVIAPATAKNVVAVGGTESYNRIPSNPNPGAPCLSGTGYPLPNFGTGVPLDLNCAHSDNGYDVWALSCHGTPATDGRTKPDVVAPATAIESAKTRETLACSNGGTLPNGSVGAIIDPASPNDQQHLWSRGTSFAAPAAAGVGALLATWYHNKFAVLPSPAMVKAMEINLAMDLYPGGRSPSPAVGHPPDNYQGFGKVDLTRAFKTDARYRWYDQTQILTPAAPIAFLPTVVSSFSVKDTTRPVTVTLVWSDAYSATGTGATTVNDLNLIVGSGSVQATCFGNDNLSNGHCHVFFTGGQGTYDHKNNVEQVVFTAQELSATFFVEVFGQTIVKDGINQWTGTTPQQDFALFIDNVIGQ